MFPVAFLSHTHRQPPAAPRSAFALGFGDARQVTPFDRRARSIVKILSPLLVPQTSFTIYFSRLRRPSM